MLLKRQTIMPGFGLAGGYTVFYLSLIVLIPLAALFLKASSLTGQAFWETVTSDRVLASYALSLKTAFAAAVVNSLAGFLVAWVLVRYRFPGRKMIDALVDLPFALPTAVAGISLTTLYAPNGWIGHWLNLAGVKVAFTPIGITLALMFIGFPFVVRSVQPVLEEIDRDSEEAARCLGATPWQTFRLVIFPCVVPALLAGFAMAFARGLGEYGSVVFIAGNMPMKTEITPLLIMTKLEQFDYPGATALGITMLLASFVMLFVINLLQGLSAQRLGRR